MGGGGGDESPTKIIRYAPYIENAHESFLTMVRSYTDLLKDDSPYETFSSIDVDPGFLGTGYILSDFPALYDMFGKFMAGLDIEVLFNQSMEDTMNATALNELVSNEATVLEDDIIESASPRFTTGMRDINSVMSSTFVVGKAMMEVGRTKALSAFSAKARYALVPAVVERWKSHLDWNRNVILVYSEMMKLYFASKIDVTGFNYDMLQRNKMWPFTAMEFERAALGVLQGAQNVSDMTQPSKAQKAIGGALTGAAAGFQIGGPIGAVIGGVLGSAAGFL